VAVFVPVHTMPPRWPSCRPRLTPRCAILAFPAPLSASNHFVELVDIGFLLKVALPVGLQRPCPDSTRAKGGSAMRSRVAVTDYFINGCGEYWAKVENGA